MSVFAVMVYSKHERDTNVNTIVIHDCDFIQDMETIGQRVIFARELRGLTQDGCASSIPVKDSVQKEFTYDYKVEGKSKDEIWKSAKAYMVSTFIDGKKAIQSEDPADGTIYGNGTVLWSIYTESCPSRFQLRFAAKDGKARLQLELEPNSSDGGGTNCGMWPMPSKTGYQEIVQKFEVFSKGLGKYLVGEGKDSSLKDF